MSIGLGLFQFIWFHLLCQVIVGGRAQEPQTSDVVGWAAIGAAAGQRQGGGLRWLRGKGLQASQASSGRSGRQGRWTSAPHKMPPGDCSPSEAAAPIRPFARFPFSRRLIPFRSGLLSLSFWLSRSLSHRRSSWPAALGGSATLAIANPCCWWLHPSS